jgi:flagellar hook-length control protein FliK
MSITELLASRGQSADYTPERAKRQSAGESFGSVLSRAENKEVKTEEPRAAKPKKPGSPKAEKPGAEKAEAAKPEEAPKTVEEKPEGANAGEKPEVKETEGSETETAEKTEEGKDAAAAFAEEVAQSLNIAVSQVLAALVSLGVKPEELKDPEKLNAFARELFGAETPAELLRVTNIKEALETIVKAAESAEQKTVAEFAKAVAEVVPEVAVKTAAAVRPEAAETEEADVPVEAAAEGAVKAAEPQAVKRPERAFNENQDGERHETQDFGRTVREAVNPQTNAGASAPEVQRAFTVAEAGRTVNTADVIEQIVSRVKVEAKADTTEVRLTLKPENLGDVSLKISAQNGIVTAQFTAESQRIKEIIEAGFNQLRDALNSQGLNIARLDVSVGQDSEGAERNRDGNRGGGRVIQAAAIDEVEPESLSERLDAYGGAVSAGSVNYSA